ncbi:MAG: glycosyltransferase [Candidatus Thermoplasmatota archaeon]|nr:glycosyltransferase [Candidatus Thermoplasmatota archaeon]
MPSTLMLLSNPYRPDPRVLLEARALRSEGYAVTLLAWDREGKWPEEADLREASVLRCGPRCPPRSPSAILARLPRFWWRALRKSRRVDFDFVHAHDFDTLPLGLLISRLNRKPLLYDAHELYAKMVQDDVGPFSDAIWIFERWMARRADEVITVSEALAAELSRGRTKRAAVVTTSQNPDVIEGLQRQAVREGYGLKGFVLSYLGSLEPGRFVEETVGAFVPEDKVTVLIGGSGSLQPMVAEASKNNPAVRYVGVVDTDEALRLTWASDLVVAMMDPKNPNNVVGTPGKVINAMAVGRPMVTTKGLEIAKKIEARDCGIVIPYSKPRFVEAVMAAAADPGRLDEMGRRGRACFDEEYSWEHAREGLLKAYRALPGPP